MRRRGGDGEMAAESIISCCLVAFQSGVEVSEEIALACLLEGWGKTAVLKCVYRLGRAGVWGRGRRDVDWVGNRLACCALRTRRNG
jgi:hypothetical protein